MQIKPAPYITYKTIDGVTLSTTQQNTIVKNAVNNGFLERSIIQLGKDLRKNNMLTKEEKAEIINETISQVYSAAKDQLVASDKQLQREIEKVKYYKERESNKRKSLNNLMSDR